MSEYGIGSPDAITWGWTPAQAIVMAEAIQRRRALDQAAALERAYLATAAAQGGKSAFSVLRSVVRRLRRQAGVPDRAEPEQLAQSLGLRVKGKQ